MSDKTIAIALMGEENVGKSVLAAGACERTLYIGKRKHMVSIEAMLGYRLTHIENFLSEYVAMIKKKEAESGNPSWQPPSVVGYHMDAWEAFVDELRKPEVTERLQKQFDAIVFDECTHALDESFRRWNSDAEEFAKKKKAALIKHSKNPIMLMKTQQASHRFVSNKDINVNTQAMFLALKTDVPYVFSQAETLGVNVFFVFHVRPAEGERGVYLRAPSRTAEQQLTELFQELYYVGQNPNKFIDGFSQPNRVFAPFIYADGMDKAFRTKSKLGTVAGYCPANIWAMMKVAGINTNRQSGREEIDRLVEMFAEHFNDTKLHAPREQAMYVWNYFGQTKKLPFAHEPANRVQAIRTVYQQAAALAWYRRQISADPFSFPLPGSLDAVKGSTPGNGGASSSNAFGTTTTNW